MADTTPRDGETTIIGSDTHFKGELTFERTAKINGRFEGQILGQGELYVSEEAHCKADIDATNVNIDGRVEGNLHAKESVRLNNGGVVKGDIVASKMIMTEGATFFGQCAVGPEAVKNSDAPSQSNSGTNGNANANSNGNERAHGGPAHRAPGTAPGQVAAAGKAGR